MLKNKILWRLNLKAQLKDWVFCAVYRTSKLLGQIPAQDFVAFELSFLFTASEMELAKELDCWQNKFYFYAQSRLPQQFLVSKVFYAAEIDI